MDMFTQTQELNTAILLALVLWTLPWKGWALWLAARNSHKWWFIILLVTNTVAILDTIYIFTIGRRHKKNEEVESQQQDDV